MTAREDRVKNRIRSACSKLQRRLQQAQETDLNEADTANLVRHILSTALGYDPLDDITEQYKVRGLFADFGIKIDGQLLAFIEVKSARTALNEKHLRQVEQYATKEGIDWLVLSNGAAWKVFRLTFSKPIGNDLVIDVDLLNTPLHELADELYYLSKESLKRREIEKLWKERTAVGPSNLLKALFSAPVLDRMRKELRSLTGYNPSPEDLARNIRDLLSPKVVEELTGVIPA